MKREELKESIRSRILEEAFAVFSEKGYTKTKLSDIAERAEIANGLVNKYFGSKENLFIELIRQRVFSKIFRNIGQEPLDELMVRYLNSIKNSIREDNTEKEFHRMLVTSTDIPFDPITLFGGLPEAEPLLKGLEAAQQRGELSSAETAASLLYALYKGCVIACRWFLELGMEMPGTDNLLLMIGYDRRAIRAGTPTYYELHKMH